MKETQKRNISTFLSIARGSAAELRTQLQLCIDIEYITEDEVNESLELSIETGKMLTVLMKKLTSP